MVCLSVLSYQTSSPAPASSRGSSDLCYCKYHIVLARKHKLYIGNYQLKSRSQPVLLLNSIYLSLYTYRRTGDIKKRHENF